MKAFKKPLLLGLIILVLAGIAYWDEQQTAKDKIVSESKNRVSDFKADDIRSLQFQRPGHPTISMERADKVWSIREPLAYPADSAGIDRLLKTLSEIQFEKDFGASQAQLKDYGLDKPLVRVVLKDKDQKTWDIQIGAKSPVGYSSYVRVNDLNKVYLVSHYVFTATNKELFDFRDKSLQLPEESQIKAISYQWKADPALRLVKDAGAWTVEQEPKQKADTAAVKSFLSQLNMQKIEGFIDSPSPAMRAALTQTGKGSEKLLEVRMEREGAEPLSIVFLENNGKIYTKLPIGDSFAEIDVKAKEELLKTARDFVDLNMFAFATGDVKSVNVDGRSFVREEDSWVSENDKKAAPHVSQLLLSLEFAKANEIVKAETAQKVMAAPPLHTITINGDVKVSLWKNLDNPESFYVKVDPDRYFLAQRDLFSALKELSAPALDKEKSLSGSTKAKS